MTKRHISYFRSAKMISLSSDYPRIHIGCVVVSKHNIVSTGCNSRTRTHKLQSELNRKRFSSDSLGMMHAEVAALLPLINKTDLTNATLYIYRESCNGELAMCRPCKGCMSLIRELGIKKIFYTTDSGFAEEFIG